MSIPWNRETERALYLLADFITRPIPDRKRADIAEGMIQVQGALRVVLDGVHRRIGNVDTERRALADALRHLTERVALLERPI